MTGRRTPAPFTGHGYVLRVGPVEYSHHRDGTPIPLADLVRWARGCGGCTLYRADGTVVVRDLGVAYGDLRHVPTGTVLRRDWPETWETRRGSAVRGRLYACGTDRVRAAYFATCQTRAEAAASHVPAAAEYDRAADAWDYWTTTGDHRRYVRDRSAA